MSKRTIVLNFPKSLTKEPITYKLVKDFDIVFNIIKARIKPNEEGTLVIQLEGETGNIQKSLDYLNSIGVRWESISRGIQWDEEKCIHCTACTSQCPTHALLVDRKDMSVLFDHEKCIACEICLQACPYTAMSLAL